MSVRHFLTLRDLSPQELHTIIHRAIEMKAQLREGGHGEPFKNQVLGL